MLPPTITTTLPQTPPQCRPSLQHRKQTHKIPSPAYRWSPRTPSWDSDALTFPSLCLKLWQVLPGGRPHVHFFSIKNFSGQKFQQFVDRVFRGYHHLSIPWGRKIKNVWDLLHNQARNRNSLPLLVKQRIPCLYYIYKTINNKKCQSRIFLFQIRNQLSLPFNGWMFSYLAMRSPF